MLETIGNSSRKKRHLSLERILRHSHKPHDLHKIPTHRSIFSKAMWSALLISSSLLGLSVSAKLFGRGCQEDIEYHRDKNSDEVYVENIDECRQFGMDEFTGQCLKPGGKLGILEVNSDGVWGKEITPKPSNVYRIGAFGASTTAGNRDRDHIGDWPEYLQDLMNGQKNKSLEYHVINFGVPGSTLKFSHKRFLEFAKKYELDMMILDCGVLWGALWDIIGKKNEELLENYVFSGNESLLEADPWLGQNISYWRKQRIKRLTKLAKIAQIESILSDKEVFDSVNSSYLGCYQIFKNPHLKKEHPLLACERYKFDEEHFIPSSNKPSIFSTVPMNIMMDTDIARILTQILTYSRDNNIQPVFLLNIIGEKCVGKDPDAFASNYEKCTSYDLTPKDMSDYMLGPVRSLALSIGYYHNIPVVDLFSGLSGEEICKIFQPWDFMHLGDMGYQELAKILAPVVYDASKSKLVGAQK